MYFAKISKWGILLLFVIAAGCKTKVPATTGPLSNTTNGWKQTSQQCTPAVTPGPVTPVPDCLWTPASGATPSSGNYVYLVSDSGEWVGLGQTYTYKGGVDATITMNASGNHLSITVNGSNNWTGDFQTKNGDTELSPGFYNGLQKYPLHDVSFGGFNWSGQHSCKGVTAWVAIDNLSYSFGALHSIDLRFEQQCVEVGSLALHGKIHWTSP